MAPQRFKFCKRCEESKSVEDFYRRSSGLLSYLCKPCTRAVSNRKRNEERRIAREARLALPLPTEKACTQCEEVKALDEFYRQGAKRRYSECKDCARKRQQEWYAQPENRVRTYNTVATYRCANPDKVRALNLRKCYGITPEDYDRLYDGQGGRCAICSKEGLRYGTGTAETRYQVLCVDHDHTTGGVRGLLCSSCNRAIGLLGEDHAVLDAAIRYLKRIEEIHA